MKEVNVSTLIDILSDETDLTTLQWVGDMVDMGLITDTEIKRYILKEVKEFYNDT